MNKSSIEKILDENVRDIRPDIYNDAYDAQTFTTNNATYKYRKAKITPTKPGGFIAVWIKDEDNNNCPYSAGEFEDFLIVAIEEEKRRGFFIFPHDVLVAQGILKSAAGKGKMGLRLYPTWLSGLNPTATKTQTWQAAFFRIDDVGV